MLEGVTIGLLAAMCATTLLGVADRFVLAIGLPWPEELSRFLLIWTSLLAAAVAMKHRSHFRLSLLVHRGGRPLEILLNVLCLGVLAVVFGYGIQLVGIFHLQRAPALGIPMSWVYAAVPVSATLIGWYLLRDLVWGTRRSTSIKT